MDRIFIHEYHYSISFLSLTIHGKNLTPQQVNHCSNN